MGGTVGGATTTSPEYLTETQYYSPSEFEDTSRRGKAQESVLIGNHSQISELSKTKYMFEMRNMKIVIYVNFTGPLIDISKSAQKNDNLGTRGDRRIDIDSSAIHANASKTSENKHESSLNKKPDTEEYQDYYADYDKLLKDYYEADYNLLLKYFWPKQAS